MTPAAVHIELAAALGHLERAMKRQTDNEAIRAISAAMDGLERVAEWLREVDAIAAELASKQGKSPA